MGDRGVSELLELASRRERFLDRLAAEPAGKETLGDVADVSRSTVDRAVAELDDAGVIEPGADGYRLTLYGRLVHGQVRELGRSLRGVDRAADLLVSLPVDTPLDPAVVRTGTINRGPAARERISTMLAGADRVRLLLAGSRPGPDPYVGWVGAATSLEAVIPEAATRRLASGDETPLSSAPAVELTLRETADPLPYTLVVAETGAASAVGACGHVDGAVDWLVATDDADAVEWGRSTVDRRWSDASPLPSP